MQYRTIFFYDDPPEDSYNFVKVVIVKIGDEKIVHLRHLLILWQLTKNI